MESKHVYVVMLQFYEKRRPISAALMILREKRQMLCSVCISLLEYSLFLFVGAERIRFVLFTFGSKCHSI